MKGFAIGRLLVGASVILNLFLIGVVVAYVVKRQQIGRGVAPVLALIEAHMPAEDAATFDSTIRNDRPRYADAEQRLLKAREGVEQAIAAQPFDPVAMTQAIDAWRQQWSAFVEVFTPSAVQGLSRISPAGRAMLAGAPKPVSRTNPSKQPAQ